MGMERETIVVVTGASAGLGRALAVEFTRRGMAVAGFGRDQAGLDETKRLAGADLFMPLAVDVSDGQAVVEGFAEVERGLGTPAILVNNAAIHPHRDFLDETPDTFLGCMAINLGGAVHCAHAALRGMVQTGKGRIINVGSFADIAPAPTCGAYSVSKGAVRIFSRTLAADLGDRFPGIVVSTWMPGILRTRMGLADGLDPALAAYWGVELSLCRDSALNGTEFERDTQIGRPRSFKRRLFEKVTRRGPRLMRLASPPISERQAMAAQADFTGQMDEARA